MPYRFLPNSDIGRTNALDAAFNQWTPTPAAQRPFSQPQYDALVAQRTPWKAKLGTAAIALGAQAKATTATEAVGTRLEQVISHFFQVLNLAIARDYFPASVRAFYQLDIGRAEVPAIVSQADRLTWAQRILDGEAARQTAEGAAYKPMAMPSAAEVGGVLIAYLPLTTAAGNAKNTYDLAQEAVQNLRPGVDAVIVDLWDTIEFTYRHDDPTSLRRKARVWGVTYQTRPGETPEPEPVPTTTAT